MTRILHISDLHFFSPSINELYHARSSGLLMPTLRTFANFALNPYRWYRNDLLTILAKDLSQLPGDQKPSWILNTGDLTATGSAKEFEKARKTLQILYQALPDALVATIPGNHDCYDKRSRKNLDLLFSTTGNRPPFHSSELLFQNRINCFPLDSTWQMVLLDFTPEQAGGRAFGVFDKELSQKLSEQLEQLKNKKVIIAAHWPFTEMHKKRNELQGRELLQKILSSHKQVKAFVHGHTHVPKIQKDDPESKINLTCAEPGPFGARCFSFRSLSARKHQRFTEPRAHIIELKPNGISINPILFDHQKNQFTTVSGKAPSLEVG